MPIETDDVIVMLFLYETENTSPGDVLSWNDLHLTEVARSKLENEPPQIIFYSRESESIVSVIFKMLASSKINILRSFLTPHPESKLLIKKDSLTTNKFLSKLLLLIREMILKQNKNRALMLLPSSIIYKKESDSTNLKLSLGTVIEVIIGKRCVPRDVTIIKNINLL